MKIFKLSDSLQVVCDSVKTRNGFKHMAVLMKNGQQCGAVKINYINRTWERYEYQSVLQKMVELSTIMTESERVAAIKYVEDYKEINLFETVAMVAKLGEVFAAGNPKAINDWKTRMLQAGLGNQGLEMPDDWETLDEAERAKRLDGVIKIMSGKN